uniref:AzlD domain-containing protein n=1 Tax=Paenirhodobacter enshiensis TaxID=1105367 RepID=UPI0035B12E00
MTQTVYSEAQIWTIILVLAIGTFVLRYSFLGLSGKRALPAWALKYLRYTSVGVLPAMVAPLVVWPAATGGTPDPARLIAAAATLLAGLVTRSVIWAILAGFATLYAMLWLLG